MKKMFEIQKFIFEKITNVAEDAINIKCDSKECNMIIYEIQNYLLMLRRLECMKLNIYEYDYDEDWYKHEAEYNANKKSKIVDARITELADLLGYDGEVNNIDEDKIWERTGH